MWRSYTTCVGALLQLGSTKIDRKAQLEWGALGGVAKARPSGAAVVAEPVVVALVADPKPRASVRTVHLEREGEEALEVRRWQPLRERQ